MNKADLGRLGENQAVLALKKQGYKILERNYRAGRWGEIDIIALHRGELVFAEVKTRASSVYGHPTDAITRHKFQAMLRAAQYYQLTHDHLPEPVRIDVVSISTSQGRIEELVIYQAVDLA